MAHPYFGFEDLMKEMGNNYFGFEDLMKALSEMSQESMEFTYLQKELGLILVESEDLPKEVFVKKNLDRLCLSCRTKLSGLKTITGQEISGYGPGCRFVFSCPSCKRSVLLSKTTTEWEYSEMGLISAESEDLPKEDFIKIYLDRKCLSCRTKLFGLKTITGQEISGYGPGCRFISFCPSCRRNVHLSKTTTGWEYSEKGLKSVESEDLSKEHKLDQSVPMFTVKCFGFKTITGQEISEIRLKIVERDYLSKEHKLDQSVPVLTVEFFGLNTITGQEISEKGLKSVESEDLSKEKGLISVESEDLSKVKGLISVESEDLSKEEKLDESVPMLTVEFFGLKTITGQEISEKGLKSVESEDLSKEKGLKSVESEDLSKEKGLKSVESEDLSKEMGLISVESEDLSEEEKLDESVPMLTIGFLGLKPITGQEISETSQESVEFKNLTNVHFPEDFIEQKFDRSCPMFTTKVLESKPITGKEISGFVPFGCLMKNSNGIEEKTILSKLKDFAGKDITVCIFNNLAVYFGLPISECLPECVVAQVFVLGKGNRPPFILTLYQDNTNHEVDNLPYQQICDEFPSMKTSPDTATNSKPQDKKLAIETKTKVRSFTVKVAKELFTLLINFCSCEFVILPCTLSYENFLDNQSSLENELKDQLRHTHSFYNGPEVLDSNTYNALSQAVRVVQGMSSIPYQLKDTTKEECLVVLDSAWQEAMQQAIVYLMSSCKHCHCTEEEDEFKVMVAVLEAARRISFSFKVEVTTSNEDVIRCLSSVKELTKKETGIALNLEAVPVKNDCEYDFLGKQRGICLHRKGKKVLLICTDKAATNETHQ